MEWSLPHSARHTRHTRTPRHASSRSALDVFYDERFTLKQRMTQCESVMHCSWDAKAKNCGMADGFHAGALKQSAAAKSRCEVAGGPGKVCAEAAAMAAAMKKCLAYGNSYEQCKVDAIVPCLAKGMSKAECKNAADAAAKGFDRLPRLRQKK